MAKKVIKGPFNIPYSEGLGLFLKDKRVGSGYSQNQLAHELGITPQYISQWERGRQSPSCDLLAQLVDLLDINQTELLDLIMQEERARLSSFLKKCRK